MPLTPFDPTVPADTSAESGGAAAIRSLTQLIKDFLTVSFNMSTGALNASAVPNGLPVGGSTGQVLAKTSGTNYATNWTTPGTVVTGMIFQWPLGSPPTGYIVCDGSTPLIATYPTLAGLLGTTYGGNGVTTFGLPDFRGRVPVGLGTGTAHGATAWTLGRQLGEETHLMTTPEMPAHIHNALTAHGSSADNSDPGSLICTAATEDNGPQTFTSSATGSTGGVAEFNVLQPSLGIQFIIKT